MISIYTKIHADHLDDVIPLIDAYLRKMVESKPRSKTREWLGLVAFYLLGHLVALAIAWGIHYAFFQK